jgi:hypothetical protein
MLNVVLFGSGATGVSDGDKGDITVSGSGATWTIDNDAVTFAKMQNITTARLLGRTTASSGDVEEISVGTGLSLASGTLSVSGNGPITWNSQSGNYTAVSGDANNGILHPSGAGSGDTFTIPANSSVAYAAGTCLHFANMDTTNNVSIAITTDTMYLAGAGSTGTRLLAPYGIATATKIDSTTWMISGIGVS